MTSPFLVADLFCGAGGSSTGAKRAIESTGATMELVAINHWDTAIETHQKNLPSARHYVEDVSVVDPEAVVEEGRLDLLMASPECKFYSRARGGKPIHDQGRMQPWAVHNWLTKLDINCVLIENVPEFVEWGPLDPEGRPDKKYKGQHFEAWLRTFWNLGYHAEWRMLNAADYGDATTRTRFFLIARKDGRPITWPEPSHAKGSTGMFEGRKRWRAAREVIDWADTGRSLLDDPKYQRKPLSEKTRIRIARGLERFGGPLAPYYIALLGLEPSQNGKPTPGPEPFINSDRQHTVARPVGAPVHTITTLTGGGQYIVLPGFVQANRTHNLPRSPDEPVPVITTSPGGGSFLVQPCLESFMLGQQSGGAPRPTDQPAPTIATDGAISLIQPQVSIFKGRSVARGVDQPLPGLTAQRHLGLVEPVITQYNGQSEAHPADDPLGTITTKPRFGLATPFLVPQLGERPGQSPRAQDIEEPTPAITSHGAGALVNPSIIQVNHGDDPGPSRIQAVSDPLPTLTAHRHLGLVEPSLESPGDELDPRRLVFINGEPYLLDIRFRMLRNAELARAMGFSDKDTEYEFAGTVAEVTKQIGNAVPVNLACALVKAILADESGASA